MLEPDPGGPPQLPMVGARPERADAAANRERILCAARALLERGGADALRMDAVAAEAGVGKGTIFRRFGDRNGLATALIDESMRAFQDAFLTGPAPLGPGAPPAERLEAFVVELVRWQAVESPLAQLMEHARGGEGAPASRALLVHLAQLLRQLEPPADPDVLASMVLNALAPSMLDRLSGGAPTSLADLQAAAVALVRGLVR